MRHQKNPKSWVCDGLGHQHRTRQNPVDVFATEHEDQQGGVHGNLGAAPHPIGAHDFWQQRMDLLARRRPRTKGVPGPKSVSRQLPRLHLIDIHWCNPMGKWPPNSPDLKLLDYSIWSILEEKSCQKPHPNVESLKIALKKALERDQFGDAGEDFLKHLKAVLMPTKGIFNQFHCFLLFLLFIVF